MSMPNKKTRRLIRKMRSTKIVGSTLKPRAVLSESNRYLRIQAIDDGVGHTLVYLTTENFKDNSYSRKNKDYAEKLAKMFADKLININKKQIVFDRNARIYCGKIKVFCEILRKQGIVF